MSWETIESTVAILTQRQVIFLHSPNLCCHKIRNVAGARGPDGGTLDSWRICGHMAYCRGNLHETGHRQYVITM